MTRSAYLQCASEECEAHCGGPKQEPGRHGVFVERRAEDSDCRSAKTDVSKHVGGDADKCVTFRDVLDDVVHLGALTLRARGADGRVGKGKETGRCPKAAESDALPTWVRRTRRWMCKQADKARLVCHGIGEEDARDYRHEIEGACSCGDENKERVELFGKDDLSGFGTDLR